MTAAAQISSYEDIKGWFTPIDKQLFDALLAAPVEPGVVIELGAYLGRSAVVIGDGLQPGERFVVLDLFGSEAELTAGGEDVANRRENQRSYATLTRTQFEANYLSLHDSLPEIVQALSTEIPKYIEPNSVRFLHIDASHLYPQVMADIRCTRELMRDDGIVVFDDYRALHTPGVAAAVWESVADLGLHPFAITASKLYASWGDSRAYLDISREFGETNPGVRCEEEQVRGNDLVRLAVRRTPAQSAASPQARASTDLAAAHKRIAQLEKKVSGMRPARRPLRKMRAKDIPAPLRPVLTKAWHALSPDTRKKVRRIAR